MTTQGVTQACENCGKVDSGQLCCPHKKPIPVQDLLNKLWGLAYPPKPVLWGGQWD